MPIGSRGAPVFIAGLGGFAPMAKFAIPFQQPSRYVISGITKDSTDAVLANCEVEIYETVSNLMRAATTSDANGVYSVEVTSSEDGLRFYAVAYKVGAPDVAGVTVNTLTGS